MPRRLVPDAELYQRRVQGATPRELANDYALSHTTLSRYLRRPDAKLQVREARAALRLKKRDRREESRRALQHGRPERQGNALAAAEPSPVFDEGGHAVVVEEAAPAPLSAVERRANRYPSDSADWLDDQDYARPPTRRETRSTNDEIADKVAAGGAGIAAVVDATGLRTEENLRRPIDPEIVARADLNDAASSTVGATDQRGPATRVRARGASDAGEP
jgi:hypothetical protein